MLAASAGIISDSADRHSGISSVRVGPAKRSQISPDPAAFVIPQLAFAMRLVSHPGALSVK